MTTANRPVFRFDRETHIYTLDGEEIPHATGMLAQCGYISEAYYTEEGAERGHIIHALTADYDLGAIRDVNAVVSRYKGWLQAHVKAMSILRPTWDTIEEAVCSIKYRYGCRPDRTGRYTGAQVVVDIKSGPPERWHGIQTALHDLALGGLPPMTRLRYGLYLKESGRFKFIPHDDKRDYDRAREVIAECCK